MLKTVILLPDGTEISSGSGNVNAIQKSTIIECVNSGEELTIGSTCANSFEATLFTPNGDFSIPAGTEVKVAKEDENGTRWDVGVFILEKPTRLTANTMKLVGYDRVSKLDKDLTAWLDGLDGWPYSLHTFAEMICDACDVPYTDDIGINLDYQIEKFTRTSVTGRQLMKWLAEIACSYCCADPEGIICFSWYTPAEAKITPTGDSYYFQNGLTYEDYTVAPVEAVQIRLADSENGALWPMLGDGINSYIITGNPILTRNLDQEILQPILNNILARLTSVSYRPCKVEVPVSMNIHAGNTVQVTDKNGVTFTAYVMTKTQSGQKDVLESAGSARRDSSSAVNNKTQAEKDAAMESYADSAANKAVSAQTADEILRRLTNDYQIQGIWQENGQWYFNAQAVHIINLFADIITAGILKSKDGGVYIDLDKGEGNLTRGTTVWLSTFDEEMGGWTKDIDVVLTEFLSAELTKMRVNTIRDFAAIMDSNSKYPDGLKLSLYKFRKSAGSLAASISLEWGDGSRSHISATDEGTGGNEFWEFSDMKWL